MDGASSFSFFAFFPFTMSYTEHMRYESKGKVKPNLLGGSNGLKMIFFPPFIHGNGLIIFLFF